MNTYPPITPAARSQDHFRTLPASRQVLIKFESCDSKDQCLKAIDSFLDLKHSHKQNKWQAMGIAAASLSALTSLGISIANTEHLCSALQTNLPTAVMHAELRSAA